MKHHPKYRPHVAGHPHRGVGTRRPMSLGRGLEEQVRATLNQMRRANDALRHRGMLSSLPRRGRT